MKTTKHDDGLEWLHDIRARLAKQFDYNPRNRVAVVFLCDFVSLR
jgi:hypothetical protein